MQFTDFTDSEYMYMLHCHNLVHEDAGMMLGLMVGP
jgi:FtsP/CotA-like multicopper oxidase with cupredoxin domain